MGADTLLSRLSTVATMAHSSKMSPVYKDLYGESMPSLNSWEEWNSLPLLKKEHLQSYPLSKRVLTDWKNLDSVYVSSGTSGKLPLFSARERLDGYAYRSNFISSPQALCSSIGQSYRQEHWMRSTGRTYRTIALDPKNMEGSVRLAKAVGVDSLYIFVHLITTFGELAKKYEIASDIRLLEFAGESCSPAIFSYLRTTFPNAVFASSMGATEMEDSPFAISEAGTDLEVVNTYTAKEGCYLELYDSETDSIIKPEIGAVGELLVTTYANDVFGFPLIRYRIEDNVRVKEVSEDKWSFTPLGRNNVDFIKIVGGIIHGDEVERAIAIFNPELAKHFRVEVQELLTKTTPQLQLVVKVYSTNNDSLTMKALEQHLEKELRVSPTFLYHEGISKNIYAPIQCVPDQTLNEKVKSRRVTRANGHA